MNLTRIRPSVRLSVGFCLLLAALSPARAGVELDPACVNATGRVASETGVPPEVLAAISTPETGRNSDRATRSWLRTVNSEGRGDWFESSKEALSFARSELAQCANSFDVRGRRLVWMTSSIRALR